MIYDRTITSNIYTYTYSIVYECKSILYTMYSYIQCTTIYAYKLVISNISYHVIYLVCHTIYIQYIVYKGYNYDLSLTLHIYCINVCVSLWREKTTESSIARLTYRLIYSLYFTILYMLYIMS